MTREEERRAERDARKAERKAEANRQKKGRLKTKVIRYIYGAPLIKFEKRSFGWHYEGKTIEEVDDGYEASYNEYSNTVSVRHKSHIVKQAYFTRPVVWPKNFLTVLTELLSSFISFISRLDISLLPVWVIVGLIVGFASQNDFTLLIIFASVWAGLMVLRILFALLGRLWAKVFKQHDRCDDILEENGFESWTVTQEGDHF